MLSEGLHHIVDMSSLKYKAKMNNTLDRLKNLITKFLKSARDIHVDCFGYEHCVTTLKHKAPLDNLMMLDIFKYLLCAPIVRPDYALRMLFNAFNDGNARY
jgi:hypothetical protein